MITITVILYNGNHTNNDNTNDNNSNNHNECYH